MTEELLSRINFLANKAKTTGLTEQEKSEQASLRMQYIKEFRQGVTNTLENVYIMDKDGNKKKIERKK
ncbi:MAG: DUF896 domain-containing protein [Clostridia bacterium]|nr:DUF896 domain-containing protein [Clostridia bacterium]